MTSIAKPARIHKAMLVIQRTQEGLSVSRACREVGVPRSTFYDICERHSAELELFQKQIEKTTRDELALVLIARVRMLEALIRDGLSETTRPREQLAIYIKLEKRLRELADELRLDDTNNAATEGVLAGPQFSAQPSRFSITN